MNIGDIQHPGIGYDAYYQKFMETNCLPISPPSRIGPHEGREMGLMIAGYKSCAIIPQMMFGEEWLAACAEHDWVYFREPNPSNEYLASYYIATREEKWRIDVIIDLFNSRDGVGQVDEYVDAKVGILLGYRPEDIQAFFVHARKVHDMIARGEDLSELSKGNF